jgi:DNA invertase Pin-like site-specific DNA recombinase
MQLAALEKAGCTKLFKDKVTGAHVKRPALPGWLKALQTADTLIVWKLDQLSHSLRDLITVLDDFKPRRIWLRSLAMAIPASPQKEANPWRRRQQLFRV